MLAIDRLHQHPMGIALHGAMRHGAPPHTVSKQRLLEDTSGKPALERSSPEIDFFMPEQALVEASDGLPELAAEHRRDVNHLAGEDANDGWWRGHPYSPLG